MARTHTKLILFTEVLALSSNNNRINVVFEERERKGNAIYGLA